jgi:predicted nucleotidyltransferase
MDKHVEYWLTESEKDLPAAQSMLEIERTIKSYVEQLERIGIHVQQAILFGSYANGTYDEWSDIDLAIVSKDFAGDRFEDRNRIRKITLQINSDISPMPFRPEDFNDSDYFVKEIMETGIKII